MFNNEKGSIPIAFIIALTSVFTVLILSNLLIIENLANTKQNKKLEQEIYANNNTLEATVNVVLQKLVGSETKYEEKTIFPLYVADITEIKNALNNNVLPHLAPDNSVTISNLKYDKSLDMLCREEIAKNQYTGEQEVTGVVCNASYFYLIFDVEIQSSKGVKKVRVKLDKLYPQESSQTGFIRINSTNLTVDFSSL